MAVSLEQFTQQIVESSLMSADDVRVVLASVRAEDRPQDGEQLARLLIRQKKLTKFQAEQIYGGKGKSLSMGNYVILDKLGQGGMGMVLKAEHRRMKRLVALKVLSPAVTRNAESMRRFQREVEAAAKLEHPNIVTAYDADEANGTHFLVMQYVEGTDLSVLVRDKGPLPVEKAVPCIVQAARGLAYAHTRGVVHRDIKPANLLLDREGTVKILDMGLARLDAAGADQDQLTGTGQIMGTVDYMAPEQAINTKSADARADIYSLGITLWYLLTGRVVFDGDSVVNKLMSHQRSPIPSLRGICPQASPELEAVFVKMVAKTPETRYQNMTAVITDLERCQGGAASSLSVAVGTAQGDDSRFSEFIRGMEALSAAPTAATKAGTKKIAAPAPVGEPTVTLQSPQVDTDPHAQQSLVPPTVAQMVTRRLIGSPWWQGRNRWIAAGCGGLLLLVGIVFFLQPVFFVDTKVEVRKGKKSLGRGTLPSVEVVKTSRAWQPTQEQQAFLDSVAKLSAEEQVAAVSRKLVDVNPGFDGKLTPIIVDGQVDGLITGEFANLWPVRALRHLKRLVFVGSGKDKSQLSDLSPLAGLSLTSLSITDTAVSELAPLRGMPLIALGCLGTGISDLTPLTGMPLTGLDCGSTAVSDLAPLARLPLTYLNIAFTAVSDLAPLADVPLTVLNCSKTGVSDLSPLARMPLTSLQCSDLRVSDLSPLKGKLLTQLTAHRTEIRDLSPLAGMPLTHLGVQSTRITDLSPVATMRLTQLECGLTGVTDLAPLAGLPLTYLAFHNTAVSDLSPLARMPLRFLNLDVPLFHEPDEKLVRAFGEANFFLHNSQATSAAFWTDFTTRQQAADSFATATAKLPPEEQVKALASRFLELNANHPVGFQPTVEGNAIVEATLTLTDTMDDVTPLRALTGLKKLTIVGGPHWLDLSPLNSTPLTSLTCRELISRRNSHVLKTMSKLTRIEAQPEPPQPAIAPFDARQARAHQDAWAQYLGVPVEYTNSIGIKFVLIPPGEFTMGSTPFEIEEALKTAGDNKIYQACIKSEGPQHKVILTKPIYLGVHEVRQQDYAAVMGNNPSNYSATGEEKLRVGGLDTSNHPVEVVSWNDAAEFCAKLSQREKLEPFYSRDGESVKRLDGNGYRLPTEAEWEFACRAGTTARYWIGHDDEDLKRVGWFAANSVGVPHAVGELKANPFGCHDIHGNVWEWIQDGWEPDEFEQYQDKPAIDPNGPSSVGLQRIIRGGIWYLEASRCRASHRFAYEPTYRDRHGIGFRVSLTVDAVKAAIAELAKK